VGDLEHDTRLEGANGRYSVALSTDWEIWGPNGGYLAVIALRAAGAEAAVRRPTSFAAHYLSVARFAPVDVTVTALHRGRRSESLRVAIAQEGRAVLEAIVRTAAEAPGLEHDTATAPDVPGPDGLRNTEEIYSGPKPYRFWWNLESRPTNPHAWDLPRAPDQPVVRDWYRFRPTALFDDPFLDAGRALLLIDTLTWPASCRHHVTPAFVAPSLDVTAWFHRPTRGEEWLLVDAVTPIGAGGLLGGTARVWSADRRLLASGGGQLYCVPQRA